MTLIEMVSHLADLTEQQFDLAVRLQGASLAALNTKRQDLLFEMGIALSDGLPEEDEVLGKLRAQVKRLRSAERRLGKCRGTRCRRARTKPAATISEYVQPDGFCRRSINGFY